MKFLVFADLQATEGSEQRFNSPGHSLQDMRVSHFYDDLVRLYREHDCDGFIDLGDTTDDRSAIPMPTIKCVGEGLMKIGGFDGQNYKLTGNHEQYQRDTTVDNRWLFRHVFHVIGDREVITLGGLKAFFCAYPENHAELAGWLKAESGKVRARKILFGHFQVKGAYLNNSQTTSGIPLEALSGFDLVLLGHIHQPQSVTDRIHYVGSPFQQDWGEANQNKRVVIVDTETLQITTVPMLHYPEYKVVNFSEFKQLAQKETEHRMRVVLKDHTETEAFFAHPAFGRAVAQYDYDTTTAKPGEPEAEKDWTFDGILARYLQQVPSNLEFSNEEMLALGQDIAKSP
jgi:DNA repair exonuclease SbcCD nuclease subunit